MTVDEWSAAASVATGKALLRRAAVSLEAISVIPTALKGVVIAAFGEELGLPPRPMLDVDILVPAAARDQCEQVLLAAGMVVRARTHTATTLRDHELEMDLDMHIGLSDPGLFKLDPAEILRRASIDTRFGAKVAIPEPYDFYAHLVAHFVRNRSTRADVRRLSDLAVVARATDLTATGTARRIEDTGLARAARYVLGLAAERGDDFAARVCAELPADWLGERIARAAELWFERYPENHPLGAVGAYALDYDLPTGVYGLALHGIRAVRRGRGQRQP